MNKSSQVKPEQLIKICSMERLFQLADMKKSVWWTPIKQLRPAAFFQNWNARNLRNNLVYGNIMEVDTSIVCAEYDNQEIKCNHQWQYNVGNPMVPLICMKCNFIPEPKEVFK